MGFLWMYLSFSVNLGRVMMLIRTWAGAVELRSIPTLTTIRPS